MRTQRTKKKQSSLKIQGGSQFTLLEALAAVMFASLILIGVHTVFSINLTQGGQALHSSLAHQAAENFLDYNISRVRSDDEWLKIFADTEAAIDTNGVTKGSTPIQNMQHQLFTINSTFQTDLREGTLSQKLRNEFAENGIQLPTDTRVSTLQENTEWLLETIDERYTLTNTNEGIRVSESKFMIYPDSQFNPSQVVNNGIFWYWEQGFSAIFRLVKKETVNENNSKKVECEVEISWPATVDYKERNKMRFDTQAFFAAKVPLSTIVKEDEEQVNPEPTEPMESCPPGFEFNSNGLRELKVFGPENYRVSDSLNVNFSSQTPGHYNIYNRRVSESGSSQTNESAYFRFVNDTNPDGLPEFSNGINEFGEDVWVMQDHDNNGETGEFYYVGTFWIEPTTTIEMHHYCAMFRGGGSPEFHNPFPTQGDCQSDNINSTHFQLSGVCMVPGSGIPPLTTP